MPSTQKISISAPSTSVPESVTYFKGYVTIEGRDGNKMPHQIRALILSTMNKWTSKTCKANGIDIHYLRTGGNKPSIVLLHGLMTSGACWTALARSLEKDYDVMMPDARGHGSSSAPNNGYSYENLANDTLKLIKELDLINPVLLGHSMGGMTAAVIASQNPTLLRGLILVEPTFLTLERQHKVYNSDVASKHCQILNSSKEDYMAEIRTRRGHRPLETLELLAEARFQTSPHAFEVLTPPNPDHVRLINALTIPSLLIIGDASAVMTSEMAIELAKCNPFLKVVQIENAGHGVPYDQPKHFSNAVKTFLDTLT